MMPDEVHMMRKEIYDSEGYTQRTSMPVWQARCAAQQPTRREHGLRANPVLRARTVALPFLFVRLCYRRLWPSSSTRRRGMCKSRYGPAVPVRAARRAMGGPALITCSFPLRNKRIKLRYYVRSPPHRSAPSRPRAPPVPSAECDRVASSRPIPIRGSCSARTSPHDCGLDALGFLACGRARVRRRAAPYSFSD